MSYTYQGPDLATILRNLANSAPQPQTASQPQTAPSHPAIPQQTVSVPQYALPEQDEDTYEPPDSISHLLPAPTPVHRPSSAPLERTFLAHPVVGRTNTPPTSSPLSRSHSNQAVATTTAPTQAPRMSTPTNPTLDATGITEWSAGLKCVMRTVAQNEAILARIKRMINNQHENEKRWWAGRQELVKKQELRIEGKKQVDDILRSIGGIVKSDSSISTPEDDLTELRAYDAKVYKASKDMDKAMTEELKAMGIPFFGTKVVGQPGGKITERELVVLQRKIIEVLEGLCGGE